MADGKNGQTPLHLAAANGRKDTVRLLLNRGASMAAKERASRMPLHLAAANGHEDVTRLLLEAGADMAARRKTKLTPLDLAAENEHDDTARLLRGWVAERDDNINPVEGGMLAPRSMALSVMRKQAIPSLVRFTEGSRTRIGILNYVVGKRKALVEEIVGAAVEDMRQAVDRGEAPVIKPTMRAALELAARIAETRSPDLIGALLKVAVSFIEAAAGKQRPSFEEVIGDFTNQFELSTTPRRKDARTLTHLIILVLKRALQKRPEVVKTVNFLVQIIRDTVRDKTFRDAVLCGRWLATLAPSGCPVRFRQAALCTGTRLLGVKNRGAETEPYEKTIAKVLKWALGAAHAVGLLDDAAMLLVELAKEHITSGVDPAVRDKDAVLRVFLLTSYSLGFVQPDTSIREAMLRVLDEIRRMD
ncbi:hypothetical protein MAPG_05668 [Magnaporthiopsis poae ATCC 64411]|uniref:Uncharacterized protein n=1 Tax=Magnaporthiopsis poae (strain ATCC 64411 / 73-15) TaxID=644358 RepID=A0A0C4E004_MAGP6|nr:hypothetical protein MAPG_05668 [Magnaporthiopsis poae ATCC 64411]